MESGGLGELNVKEGHKSKFGGNFGKNYGESKFD